MPLAVQRVLMEDLRSERACTDLCGSEGRCQLAVTQDGCSQSGGGRLGMVDVVSCPQTAGLRCWVRNTPSSSCRHDTDRMSFG